MLGRLGHVVEGRVRPPCTKTTPSSRWLRLSGILDDLNPIVQDRNRTAPATQVLGSIIIITTITITITITISLQGVCSSTDGR